MVSLELAREKVLQWKKADEKIVFTNGCFDILHQGHVVYLTKSADLGNRLIVGLNSDASVREQQKGDDRPINDENSRAIILSALEVVDLVIVYNESTPYDLISILQPDVLVKGADYNENQTDKTQKDYIVGSDIVKANGGTVKTIALEKGFSTTRLINKIKH